MTNFVKLKKKIHYTKTKAKLCQNSKKYLGIEGNLIPF